MTALRRVGLIAVVITSIFVPAACDILVAPMPFGAPADSATGDDETGGVPETDSTTDGVGPVTADIVLAHAGVNILVVEGGPNETVSVSLNSEPIDTVSVTVTPGAQLDLGFGAGVPITQNFAPSDWNIPQSVAVSAVNDAAVGAFTDTIAVTTTSSDPQFDALARSAPVIIEDDERTDTIYAVADDLLYRFDDMAGSGATTYDGGGTPFSNGLSDVAVDAVNSYIYTVDGNNNFIYRFEDMVGLNQTEYDGSAGNPFASPQGVAFFGTQIYVSDITSTRIYALDGIPPVNQDEYTGNVGTTFQNPLRVYVDASGIYVVDFGTNLLYRFNDMTGAGQEEYDGSAATAFQNPRDVAVDSLGRIYVVDRVNTVVQRIDDMTGANAVEYDGGAGTAFANPTGIWIDGDDRIYVTDNFTGLLYRFDDMSGTHQVEYDVTGALGSISNVFVVD